jgi:hypothetical protein
MLRPVLVAPDFCARCGNAFTGPDDRRAQLRAPDLCRACHLDPRARALPLETDLGKNWLTRCARTLFQLLVTPSASFRIVEEPVSHARILGFLATLRLPLWGVALLWPLSEWALTDAAVSELRRPSVIGQLIGAQFADVLRVWLMLMVPLGLPMLYFFGGILAHSAMALTGGARRSIGATMRAFGLALAPSLVLVGILDVLVIVVGVDPETWIGPLMIAGFLALTLLAVALARTHSTSLVRGFVVALVPVTLFMALTVGRGLLDHTRLPFMEPTPIDSYAPYPIK